ncbi:hypothetical protein Xoosp13_359 [Xanthomonas phage Xoo-sp13]|nr:hypothetical protein Xoosp13_359 [Xanthomonas phage Xoo-sp13]
MKVIVSKYLKEQSIIDASALAKELNEAVRKIHVEYGVTYTHRDLSPQEVINVIQVMISAGEFNDVINDIRTEYDEAGDIVSKFLHKFSNDSTSRSSEFEKFVYDDLNKDAQKHRQATLNEEIDNAFNVQSSMVDTDDMVYVDFYNTVSDTSYSNDSLNEIIFYTFKFPNIKSAQVFVNYNADSLDGQFIRYYNFATTTTKKIIFP